MRRSAMIAMSTALVCAALTPALRATPISAFQFPEPAPLMRSVTGTDGFRFTPNVNIIVTALGYYDAHQDGLTLQHPVAIYDYDSQTMLTSATVGPASLLDGSFRFEPVNPLVLAAGNSYLVAGYHPGSTTEDFAATPAPSDLIISPSITYQGYSYVYGGSTVEFPTTPYANFTFFGPNFQLEPIPEPLTLALTGSGLLLLMFLRRRRGLGPANKR